ncbi:MAG: hypothetical protein WCJ64_05285 [Rhodospirillaceae bacterium]
MRVHEQAIALTPEQIALMTQHQIESFHPDIIAPISGASFIDTPQVSNFRRLEPRDTGGDDGFWLPDLEHEMIGPITSDQINVQSVH